MKQYHKYIGLDVHKERNEIAIADGTTGEVRLYGSISNDLHALEKLVVKLRGENLKLHFVYEAGPCGFENTKKKAEWTTKAPEGSGLDIRQVGLQFVH